MTRTIARLLLVLAATLTGCAPAKEVPLSAAADGPLLPSLQIYMEAGEVHFVLQVTNVGERPLDLRFPDGQTHDFEVIQGDREIWRWSADRMFTQALREERVEVGESLRFEGSWQPPAGVTGELVGIGRLVAEEGAVAQASRFRVE